MFRNQENPLIRLIRVLTIWRVRGGKTRKHHRTRATVKVAPVQRGGTYCATVWALWGNAWVRVLP